MTKRKEGEVDSKIEGGGKVDYNERVNQKERMKTTTTLRERATVFGETRLEKIEREREKIKVEKRARDKVERGKKVTEKKLRWNLPTQERKGRQIQQEEMYHIGL